ncbi:MAG: OB-fold nucleic acid binding domain-containing protein [Actinophytocola sp.]|uniref:OB-fold nucleic acid binding domain-containing protein n=1 Tax=Actinophytocola sp. TaxID=1872138 RepID=UPI003D6BA45F
MGTEARRQGQRGNGSLRRLVKRLTTDIDELDADDLSEHVDAENARRACDCRSGEEVTVLGRLRAVELSPRDAVATLEAELFDGTEGVTLVWLGRRRIAGIEPGRTIKAQGRIALRDGRKVLYNPYYELQTTT